MTRQTYMSSVVPIGAPHPTPRAPFSLRGPLPVAPSGALFACTLWFGNAAYTYLSVSFIQMLKALMPAAVYACSVAWVRAPFSAQRTAPLRPACALVSPHPPVPTARASRSATRRPSASWC